MQIFDETKKRGVKEILFISVDGVSGLSEGAKAIFPNVTIQKCVIHFSWSGTVKIRIADVRRVNSALLFLQRSVFPVSERRHAELFFKRDGKIIRIVKAAKHCDFRNIIIGRGHQCHGVFKAQSQNILFDGFGSRKHE